MTRWIGVPYHRTTGRLDHDGVIDRFFGADPVPFRSSLVLECGSRADDTESIVNYCLARDAKTPMVRSPDHWQVTSPLPCPAFETFKRVELPERKHGPWGEYIEEGGARLPIRTVATKHAWADLSAVYRNGAAPETPVDHAVYARTRIESDGDAAAHLRVGFDEWLTVWLNGSRLPTVRHDAGLKAAAISAQLKKGENELLIKLSNSPNTNHRLWAWSCGREV